LQIKKGCIIQADAHYCGISRTGSNTTTGPMRKIDEVLEEMRSTRESQWEGSPTNSPLRTADGAGKMQKHLWDQKKALYY